MHQRSIRDFEALFSEPSRDSQLFIIKAKDRTKSGWITYFLTRFGGYATSMEIGYIVTPDSHGKGYCSEAAALIQEKGIMTLFGQ